MPCSLLTLSPLLEGVYPGGIYPVHFLNRPGSLRPLHFPSSFPRTAILLPVPWLHVTSGDSSRLQSLAE